ncbi:MAG: methyltransferase domain-containing protein [Phycisphaerae bacterium]|jgi:predicted SAM-dependent methyltransferase
MTQRSLRSLARALHIEDSAKAFVAQLRRDMLMLRRRLAGADRKAIDSYFRAHEARRLHIGCGDHLLSGWLNSTYYPQSHQVLHLDATRPFPFADATFEHVYSEHMIEHITFDQGLGMLAECYRVLKPGGRIRISTPDLSFLVDLYRADKPRSHREYLKWATDCFNPAAPFSEDTFVINTFVRNWGHVFIYDEKVLRHSVERAGFTGITRCSLGNSDDAAMRNLENTARIPENFLRMESLILEGVKP